jgi:hypothetical protein
VKLSRRCGWRSALGDVKVELTCSARIGVQLTPRALGLNNIAHGALEVEGLKSARSRQMRNLSSIGYTVFLTRSYLSRIRAGLTRGVTIV